MTAPDDDYMTVREFAGLPSDARHAVWTAGEALIDVIHVNGNKTSGIRRWHRAQVLELLQKEEVAAS